MARAVGRRSNLEKAVDIVRDAGGKVTGRTRFQKIAYLFEIAGVGDDFVFEFRRYGPYSQELANAIRNAALLGHLNEEERPASWGGFYSTFTVDSDSNRKTPKPRRDLAQIAVRADPVDLELAATAAFLSFEGRDDPWSETRKLKPEKARGGRLKRARSLYERLRRIETPRPLPEIP
jgi:hypothetical protein